MKLLVMFLLLASSVCFAQYDQYLPVKCGEHKHIDLDDAWKDCKSTGHSNDVECTITGRCIDDLVPSSYDIIPLFKMPNEEIYFVIPDVAHCSPPDYVELGMKTVHCWIPKKE